MLLFFFLSGESVNPFLLGAACKSWKNQFSHLKNVSEMDLGKEFHTFEITKYPVQPVSRGSRRKMDLVLRGESFLQVACEDFIRGGGSPERHLWTTRQRFRVFIDHRPQAYARYWGPKMKGMALVPALQKLTLASLSGWI